MSIMDEEAKDFDYGYSEEWSLFEKPTIEAGTSKVKWVPYKPISALSGQSAIEFQVS